MVLNRVEDYLQIELMITIMSGVLGTEQQNRLNHGGMELHTKLQYSMERYIVVILRFCGIPMKILGTPGKILFGTKITGIP